MAPKLQQTIHSDRLRIAGPWAAWCVGISIISSGVWHAAGAKAGIDKVADGVSGLRAEVQEIRREMAKDREILHEHGAELREHRVMINELQRKTGTRTSSAEYWEK